MEVTKGRCQGHKWTRLDDPIFRSRHWVFVGPKKTASQAMLKVARAQVSMEHATMGRCIRLEGPGVETILYISTDVEVEHVETLVHEAHHAAFYTLSQAGLALTEETKELFAYFHEWLVREGRKGVGI